MSRRLLLWVSAITSLLIVGGISIFFAIAPFGKIGIGQSILKFARPGDHILGNVKSGKILIEYSDFACPACRIAFVRMKKYKSLYGHHAAFIFRHYPLPDIHPNAVMAAMASEAAARQGKFWEMHDNLFEKQRDWAYDAAPEKLFSRYAKSIGLHAGRFIRDLESLDVRTRVANDHQSGDDAGVFATPSFFLDGKEIHFRELVTKLEELMKGKNEK